MSSNLTNLPQLTAPTNSDWLYIVDVSDTTDNPAGSSKKILRGDLYAQITGFTYLNNAITLSLSDNSTYQVVINTMTGLTINGVLSATTYANLPLDVYTTGGTYDNGTITFTNNSGGTFNVSGLVTGDTYWTSGSTGNYSIKTNNDSGLDATGNYAVAEGYGTLASGNYSHSEGYQTTASGEAAHAEGELTTANGHISHAEGLATTTIGEGTHTEGRETTAIGDYSHAEGYNTKAYGNQSHTEGGLTIANGDYSHAEGQANTAYGVNSHAEGTLTIASGGTSHAEGYGSIANGDVSHAEGHETTANGDFGSHSEGYQTTASGNGSHAEGGLTIASGGNSHAEGTQTIASGSSSHSEGSATIASGENSHAEGSTTIASDYSSHAEGDLTIASGYGSHAEGTQTTASNGSSHAEGNATVASGAASHSEGGNTTARGDYSHAGGNNSIASGNTSFIHSTDSLVTGDRSAVLGGQNIIGTTDDTVYVPYFNIQSATTNNSLSEILVIDTNGDVKKRDVTTIGNRDDIYWTSGSTGNYSIKAKNDSGLDATGDYAVAEGYGTLASGYFSHAQNNNTTASGENSHAEGQYTTASGENSHAEGNSSVASGNDSHAEGLGTTASGFQAHAEGDLSVAGGSASHAEGYNTTAEGAYSHSEGRNTIASGDGSHAEGYRTLAQGSGSHAEGGYYHNGIYYSGGTALGRASHAEGYQTTASNEGSHSEGILTISSGIASHAEGNLTTASANASHAEGRYTTASEEGSHAEGRYTTASGSASHAEGSYNIAVGESAHAEGNYTTASGDYSHTEGSGTIANSQNSHAEGNYTLASGENSHAEGYYSLAQGDGSHAEGLYSQAIGDGSHAEGGYYDGIDYLSGGTAIGHGSHAEGRRTISGWKGFTVDSVVYGLITLNSSYGDVTSEFTGYKVILDEKIYTYNTVTFSSTTNTEILLNDTTVIFGGYVSDLDNLNSPYGEIGDNGVNSHAEGSQTKSLGYYSHAEGSNTIASGNYGSHAEGNTTTASGEASHAEGDRTKALGDSSHSEGVLTVASGQNSHAEGGNTLAQGHYSHAEGYFTTASGEYSHAEGESTIASGVDSHAEGYYSLAQGDGSHAEGGWDDNGDILSGGKALGKASHAEGSETIAGWKGFSIDSVVNGLVTINSSYGDITSEFFGNKVILDTKIYTYNAVTFSSTTNTEILLDDITVNTGTYVTDLTNLNSQYADTLDVFGRNTHAEGNNTKSIGVDSHAEGYYTIAGGTYGAHAEGDNTTASGNASHAEGEQTTASGMNSHAEGRLTIASGEYSHAEGSNTTAIGPSSHVEGSATKAIGQSSHAEGGNTTASGNYSHAGGNNSIASGDTSFIHSKYSLVTGDRSVVLGGEFITGTADDTVYVPYFNIQSATTDNSLTEVLVIDTNGDVKKRTVGSVDTYTTGFTFDVSNYDLTIQQNNGQTDLIVNLGILSSDVTITGGTYNPTTGIAEFTNNTGGTFSVSGFLTGMTDTYVSGFTYNNNNFTIKQTAGKPDLIVNLNTLTGLTINGDLIVTGQTTTGSISATTYYNLPQDIFTTGGTYNNTTGIATFTNNSGGTFNVSGFYTGSTDNYTTGYTYNNNTFTIKRNNGLSDLTTTINTMTGLTINGNLIVTGQTTTNSLSASTITATTITASNYENLPFTDNQTLEIIISGGSEYVKIKDTITAPSGGTRVFEGNVKVNSGFTANTISATTYYNLPASTDTYTTGGTYNNTTGIATFTNNSGGTFNVSGFYTGSTDSYTTGYTYSNNTFTIKRNNGLSDLSVNVNTMTGLTINGNLNVTGQTTTNSLSATTITATTITATDYQNLPFTDNQTIEGFVSGSTTYVRLKDVVSAPSGGTRTFQGNVVVNGGFTANTISATTYYNLPASVDTFTTGFTFNVSNYDLTIKQNNGQTDLTVNLGVLSSDMTVTGGTYNPTTGVATFTNNTGGTFSVSGFLTGMTDTYVSGFTYSNNNLTIKQTAGKPDLSVNINTLTGLTINGDLTVTGQTTTNSLSANTISATTYYNLPMLSGAYLPLSGGTVTGGTSFTNGLTANTISATTLQFDTTYTGTVLPGQIAWDSNFGTLQQGLVGGNVTQKIGETSFAMVKNVETTTINKGQVVYIFGATGDKISVKLASNTGDTTSSKTLGIAAENIAANQNGLIITQGTLDGLNLGSYTAGDILWLSSTPGQFTTVKQYAPSHLVFIGVVQRANNGNGQIYVKPQNGYEIDELHNVLATGATYGDLLVYSAYNGSDIWVNTKTLTGNYVINGNLNVTGGTQSIFSGKVGVGLTNPASQLHVRSTAIPSDREIIAQFDVTDDSSYFRISNVTGVDGNFIPSLEGYNSTEKIALYFLAVGTTDTGTEPLINFNGRIGQSLVVTRPLFKWSNYDSTKMTMLANGNLGIGTETPTTKLEVDGTYRLGPAGGILFGSYGSGTNLDMTALNIGGWSGVNKISTSDSNGSVFFGTYGSGTSLIRTYWTVGTSSSGFDLTTGIHLLKNGNVGVGITNPTASLHINNTSTSASFLVEDDSNPDSTPFVIDNTGNVGIGTTTPTAKLDVSGDTRITGTLTATTISATTYQNLPKVAFSPMNVSVCDTAPTAATTQYYYQSIAEVTATLSKVKLWGFSGSDIVLFGIYRGTLQGTMTLIGQAKGTCGVGPNELTLSAETGQNLSITAGENIVVGYYTSGTSWRTVYNTGISDINFGLINTTDITTMPASPTGTATGIRFACTLY